MQTLRDYISWCESRDEYKESKNFADPKSWGWRDLGNRTLPELDLTAQNFVANTDNGYDSSTDNDTLNAWARREFPDLAMHDTRIQRQKPREAVPPHIDFKDSYLKKIARVHPQILEMPHSLKDPCVKVWQVFIACEDRMPGQSIVINGTEWEWKRGDCILIDHAGALHSTANESKVDRMLIKMVAIEPLDLVNIPSVLK